MKTDRKRKKEKRKKRKKKKKKKKKKKGALHFCSSRQNKVTALAQFQKESEMKRCPCVWNCKPAGYLISVKPV